MVDCSALRPDVSGIDPLESGIPFFEEQKRFTFLLEYKCNKVFLNHVDSFNGRHILRYLGSREYIKPIEYEELPREGGSLPTLPQTAPSIPSIKSSAMGSASQPAAEGDASDGSKPVVLEAVSQLRRGEGDEGFMSDYDKDSLLSLLGGLMSRNQVAVLRSLPTQQLRAEYIKNILFQADAATEEVAPEELPPEILYYEVSGTMKYCDECLPEVQTYLKERVKDLKAYLPTLLSCGTVIFDISREPSQIEEARWALRAILCSFQFLEKKSMLCFNKIKDVRKFILISSAMTWENTDKMKIRKRPVSENDLGVRKAHPLFREHKHLEQEVVRAGFKYPDLFKTYVLASGIPYGYEEDRLNYLFDLGWKNYQELPLLGDGHNSLPVIHIEDLAMLVLHCMVKVDVSPSYFLASEKNPPTLLQITESISDGLTTGKTTVYSFDEPLPTNINIHEDTYAMVTSELLLEPTIHKLDLPWKYNMNIHHNIAAIIDEYIEYRNLCAFKILVGGPPASGKTNVADRIAKIYDLKYISIPEIVNDYIEKLEREALEAAKNMEAMMGEEAEEGALGEEEEGDEEIKDEEYDRRPVFSSELEEIKHSMAVNNGVPEDAIIFRILKMRLEEKDVLNHGYVIDGWPETSPQAQGMFGKDDEEDQDMLSPEHTEEEEEDDDEDEDEELFGEDANPPKIHTRNFDTTPNYVVQLEGDCDELLFRVLAEKQDLPRKLPSSIRLAQKVEQYRDMEKMGCRAFDYFDNKYLDMKIMRYNLNLDPCPHLGRTLKNILDTLGPPSNKGLLRRYLEEYKLIRRVQAEKNRKKKQEIADEIEKMDVEYFRAACQFMENWVYFKDNEIMEVSDCGGLNNDLLPLNVLETTIKALIHFKHASPDDHLEFLAEYFLRVYEEEKGRDPVSTSGCDDGVQLRRCIAAVLEKCEPCCLPLLPQAVDIIMKYKRFAEAKGTTFPPISCREEIAESLKRKESQVEDKLEDTMPSTRSLISQQDDQSSKSLTQLSLRKLVDILIKTDPIWKLKFPQVDATKLAISDDSLKMLLEQLKQLSCEIQYRLKKRGVKAFDGDSPIGSYGDWPYQGPDKECSGEIRTQHPSEPSLNTRQNLQDIKRGVSDHGHHRTSNRSDSNKSDSNKSDSKKSDSKKSLSKKSDSNKFANNQSESQSVESKPTSVESKPTSVVSKDPTIYSRSLEEEFIDKKPSIESSKN